MNKKYKYLITLFIIGLLISENFGISVSFAQSQTLNNEAIFPPDQSYTLNSSLINYQLSTALNLTPNDVLSIYKVESFQPNDTYVMGHFGPSEGIKTGFIARLLQGAVIFATPVLINNESTTVTHLLAGINTLTIAGHHMGDLGFEQPFRGLLDFSGTILTSEAIGTKTPFSHVIPEEMYFSAVGEIVIKNSKPLVLFVTNQPEDTSLVLDDLIKLDTGEAVILIDRARLDAMETSHQNGRLAEYMEEELPEKLRMENTTFSNILQFIHEQIKTATHGFSIFEKRGVCVETRDGNGNITCVKCVTDPDSLMLFQVDRMQKCNFDWECPGWCGNATPSGGASVPEPEGPSWPIPFGGRSVKTGPLGGPLGGGAGGGAAWPNPFGGGCIVVGGGASKNPLTGEPGGYFGFSFLVFGNPNLPPTPHFWERDNE